MRPAPDRVERSAAEGYFGTIDECRCADSFTRSFTSSPHLPYARDSHTLRSIVTEIRARTARSDAVPLKRFAPPLRRERQLGIQLGQQFSRGPGFHRVPSTTHGPRSPRSRCPWPRSAIPGRGAPRVSRRPPLRHRRNRPPAASVGHADAGRACSPRWGPRVWPWAMLPG